MPLVPSYIKKLKSYKPGKPIEEVQRELGFDDIIKLASNENPLGPSPKALSAIQNSMIKSHRYPDASGYELRKKLSDRFSVNICLLYTSPSPRDDELSRMPSSA